MGGGRQAPQARERDDAHDRAERLVLKLHSVAPPAANPSGINLLRHERQSADASCCSGSRYATDGAPPGWVANETASGDAAIGDACGRQRAETARLGSGRKGRATHLDDRDPAGRGRTPSPLGRGRYPRLDGAEAYRWLHTLNADRTSSSASSGMSTTDGTSPSSSPPTTVPAIEPAVIASTKVRFCRSTAKLPDRL